MPAPRTSRIGIIVGTGAGSGNYSATDEERHVSREPGHPAEPATADPANPLENPRPVPAHAPLDVPGDPEDIPLGGPEVPPVPTIPGPAHSHPLGPPEPQP